jgi:hypothetical protein
LPQQWKECIVATPKNYVKTVVIVEVSHCYQLHANPYLNEITGDCVNFSAMD